MHLHVKIMKYLYMSFEEQRTFSESDDYFFMQRSVIAC